VFDDRSLRGMFSSKREEVTGGWRKLNNEETIIYTLHQIFLG
jgi:hypothetical protein